MAGMSSHDQFENRYMARFEALLSEHGLVVEYQRDRAGIDTGLHLFAPDTAPTSTNSAGSHWHPLTSRVWFQLKGKHTSTTTARDFATAPHIPVTVDVDHLKYWFAAPEPVYLVVYIESVDTFIGTDVRELIERRRGPGFYPAMETRQGATITVHVPTDAIIDTARVAAMTTHRSMRIDGPAHRGRPLGHRLDPLRSVLTCPSPQIWLDVVMGLLVAHDFVEHSRNQVGEVTILHGVLHQTLLWQSPALTEYGWAPGQLMRDEAPPEYLVGPVCLVLDAATSRRRLTSEEHATIETLPHPINRTHDGDRHDDLDLDLDLEEDEETMLAILFRGNDLSSTGGLWRSTPTAARRHHRQIGLEALSYLLLVSTLVYLEHAPHLHWDHVDYL
jgi:Domain of unknown function (DUF4365)